MTPRRSTRLGRRLGAVLVLSLLAAACADDADESGARAAPEGTPGETSGSSSTEPASDEPDAAPDGSTTTTTPATTTTVPNPEALAFDERRDRYREAMLDAAPDNFDHWSATAALVLDHARRTGDDSLVADANEWILDTLAELEPSTGTNEMGILHGAAYTFLHLALAYGDDPDLLYPTTYAAIVRGEYPDGASRPQQSLIAYRDQMFQSGYDSQNLALDVRSGTPWDPARNGSYNGTENHKLQAVTTGLLLAQLYEDDVVGGVPVRDDTPELDDQWHYFRDAFFRLSDTWADGLADHFRTDVMSTERDSVQYLPTHLGDYWMLMNLSSDPVVRSHARVFVDRLLVDWAEDLLGPVQTGAAERISRVDLDAGLAHQEHVANYLLFDNLGEPIPGDHPELYDFGGWVNLAIATSDYHPGSSDFPRAVVDLAVDKGDGYTVREGGIDHNWIESDLALGFRLDGRLFAEDRIGGFFVLDDEPGTAAGRMATIFHGDTPFSKDQVPSRPEGVQDERVAVVRTTTNDGVPTAVWIQSGFDQIATTGDRIVVSHRSAADRDVYLSISSPEASFVERGPVDGGRVFETDPGAVTVWEVATSDEFPTVDAFVAAVAAGTLQRGAVADAETPPDESAVPASDSGDAGVDARAVTVVSGLDGVELRLADDPTARAIDGRAVDWSAYEFSFSNPWAAHRLGSTVAALDRDGASVSWDWSPDGEGSFDREPTVQVHNQE